MQINGCGEHREMVFLALKVLIELFNNEIRDCLGESSTNTQHQRFWNRMWKMRLPKKIKIFT